MQLRARFVLLAATLAVPLQPVAAQDSCITEDELGALVIHGVPIALAALRNRCAASLPSDSFLNAQSAQVEARYRRDGRDLWPAAREAFFLFAQDGGQFDAAARKELRSMDEAQSRRSMEEFVQGEIFGEIPQRDCAAMDRLLAALAPLEPAQAAEIVISMALMARPNNPSICPVEPR